MRASPRGGARDARRACALAAALALAAPAALASCTKDACARNSECAGGLVCGASGRCVVPPVDASLDDGAASPTDAAGTSDASTSLDAAVDAPSSTDYQTGPSPPCPQFAMRACPPQPASERQEPRWR